MTVTSQDGTRQIVEQCFLDFEDCSPVPCNISLVDLHSGAAQLENLKFDLSTHSDSSNPAYIWEIDVSYFYEPDKVVAYLHEDGRARLDSTMTIPDFNTQLSSPKFTRFISSAISSVPSLPLEILRFCNKIYKGRS